MSEQRRSDKARARSHFRTERLSEEGGKWYFATREGTMEGPYSDKFKALEGLEAYITIVELHLVEEQIELARDPRMLPTVH
ncbi:MAG: DUF6316 family protein [Halioglobus sp.]